MKKPYRYICSFLLLSASVTSIADPLIDSEKLQASIERVVQKVAPATVEVKFVDRGGDGTFSAVIVSPDGYILSAGHAVQPDNRYQVFLPDGRKFDAVGLGTEPRIDMGLIKIVSPQNLPVAEMGWSSNLQRDEPCISLGYPGSYDPDRGVVVRFGRIADPVAASGYIQSTCLMEPGDSGGPLFDMQGRVIGIHSNIGRSLDKNHEVPVDQFRRYWSHLLEAKEFHGYSVEVGPDFGFEWSQPDSSRSTERSMATVNTVTADSLAEQSGLLPGDRILSINGETAKHLREAHLLLQRAYTLKLPAVDMRVKRSGNEVTVKFQLPDNKAAYTAWSEGINVIQAEPAANPVAPMEGLKNLSNVFAAEESRLDASAMAVVSTLDGADSTVLATLIAPGNKLVSKSSLVGDSPKVTYQGKTVEAEIIARDKKRDLVLLKLPLRLKGGVNLAAGRNGIAPRGQLLVSPHPDTEGRVSVSSTGSFSVGKTESAGFLGVQPESADGKVKLTRIFPGTPAATVFQNGDYVLAINGAPVETSSQLIEQLKNYDPGDRVELSAQRDGEAMSVAVVLGTRSQRQGGHVAEYFHGGKSKRRDGFPAIFSHDARLLPEECGGPLFTVDGDFAGINIARFSRTRTYAVPASEVADFVSAARK